MQVTFDTKQFTSTAQTVSKLALKSNMSVSSLSFVRLLMFPVQGGVKGFLSASNGTQVVNRPIDVSVEGVTESMTLLLKGDKLSQIAAAFKGMDDKPVKFKPDYPTGTFSCGRSKFKIEMSDPETYPDPIKITGEKTTISMPYGLLVSELSRVRHAVASNDTRTYLNGINLTFNQGVFTVTGSDGHRMFRSVMGDVKVSGKDSASVLIPVGAIEHICGSTDSDDTNVVINLNNQLAEFATPSAQVKTLLIDEKYPNTEPFFTSAKSRLVDIDRAELVGTLTRLNSVITSPKYKLKLSFEENEIRLTALDAHNQEIGEDVIACPVEVSGKEVGFSCRYLIDALQNLSGERVQIQLDDSKGFLLLNPDNDESTTAVVMPMRI